MEDVLRFDDFVRGAPNTGSGREIESNAEDKDEEEEEEALNSLKPATAQKSSKRNGAGAET